MANDLVISVGASIRDLERQMKAAADVAAQRADEIEKEFKKRNPQFGGTAMAFGLGAIGGAAALAASNLERVGSAIMAANREIASFAQTSRQAGIELERFQQLRFAAGSEGISGKAFDSGIQGLAKELNEARREETELGKFLEANNIKIRDRRGEVLSTNQALSIAADLVSRAASEADKIAIAEKFKLPAEFVPLLENGSAALDKLALKASEAGAVLTRDVIEKAEGFDKAWNSAWNTFVTYAKAAVAEVSQDVGKLFQMLFEFRQRMINAGKLGAQMGEMMSDEIQGKTKPAASEPVSTTSPYPPSRPGRGYIGTDATRFASSGSKGGGGGGGKSDEEKRTEQVNRYIDALERANRVLAAEEATLGRSKAERAAAIELARIGTVTDEEQKQKIIEIVGANERYRESIERTRQAQKDLNEAQKYFGSAAVDALEDLIVNGSRAEDVMKRLVASLAKAALQAALLGDGPLAGLFGTKGVGGNVGGLFGMLFGSGVKAATGGYISGPGTGRSDSIPARLSNGEYVVNARATKQNRALLEAINSGKLPAFADGGLVGGGNLTSPNLGLLSKRQQSPAVNVNVTNNAQAQVRAEQQPNGDISVVIDALEGRMADRVLRGQGALSQAFGARQSNRQLRG